MKKWMLLYGGKSGEHEVSRRSASFIYRNLLKSGFEVVPVAVSYEGAWYIQKDIDPESSLMPCDEKSSTLVSMTPGFGFHDSAGGRIAIDGIFPVIHGTYGEDGTLQGFAEMMNIPYVGANLLSSALAMDKIMAKKIWKCSGLPVTPGTSIDKYSWYSGSFDRELFLKQTVDDFGFPLFIKPSNAGSSVGVGKADSRDDLIACIDEAFNYDTGILIEKAVSAREIEISVIGNRDIKVFKPGEICPHHSFYDYEAKYSDPDGASLIIPAKLNKEDMDKAADIASKAYKALNLNGLSRVDLFIDRETGEFYINEINTMPGFTSISMFPMLCEAGGLKPDKLIKELIDLAVQRYTEKNNLTYRIK